MSKTIKLSCPNLSYPINIIPSVLFLLESPFPFPPSWHLVLSSLQPRIFVDSVITITVSDFIPSDLIARPPSSLCNILANRQTFFQEGGCSNLSPDKGNVDIGQQRRKVILKNLLSPMMGCVQSRCTCDVSVGLEKIKISRKCLQSERTALEKLKMEKERETEKTASRIKRATLKQ